MSVLLAKFKEVLISVSPIVAAVLLLHFTIVPLSSGHLIRFLVGSVFVILGLTIFLIGVDTSVQPIGRIMGGWMARSGNPWILIFVGMLLGFIISIAEPALHVLGYEVESVTAKLITQMGLVGVVSVGMAVMVAVGLFKIAYNWSSKVVFALSYVVIGVLAAFSIPEFQAIAFDASGATTGAMAVPFMLALSLGVSSLSRSSAKAEEDSFGLIGAASAGAIAVVLIMGLIQGVDRLEGAMPVDATAEIGVGEAMLAELGPTFVSVVLALLPIYAVFFIFHATKLKVRDHQVKRISIGGGFTFVGLFLFLYGVYIGFMEVGTVLGDFIVSRYGWIVVPVGFVLGIVTILAEPAVHVLTDQIEEATSGYVPRRVVLMTLSIGVGVAVALSMLRIIIPDLKLWHYLLPGYIIAIGLMPFTPKLFVGMAFDSGGVATGPMTATFILAFANGVAAATPTADIMMDGFGMIALVAMTPIIAIEILGVVFNMIQKKNKEEIDDEHVSESISH